MDIKYTMTDDGTELFSIDPALGRDGDFQSPGVLMSCTPVKQKTRGFGLSNIVSSIYYVHRDTLIGDVVEEMNSHESLLAIGMVGDNCEPLGVITRRELFNLLGRSFGEWAAKDMPVSRIAKQTAVYREDANIVTVSGQVAHEMKKPTLRFFIIVDSDGKFAGIFSTRDIMNYLAVITGKDLQTAGLIQSRIVPENMLIKKGGVEAGAYTQMAKGVGGDFYAIKSFKDDKWFFLMADVSGKGLGASLLTSIIGGFIHMHNFSAGLKRLITRLNSYIFNTFNAEKFITSVFMAMDGVAGYLNIYDMGHSMIYLIRENKIQSIKSEDNNLPLGIIEHQEPVPRRFKLKNGDIVFVVTDGVTEQCNLAGDEYGIDRCADIIKDNTEMPVDQILGRLKENINNFRGEEQQLDDISFMLIKYKAKE